MLLTTDLKKFLNTKVFVDFLRSFFSLHKLSLSEETKAEAQRKYITAEGMVSYVVENWVQFGSKVLTEKAKFILK